MSSTPKHGGGREKKPTTAKCTSNKKTQTPQDPDASPQPPHNDKLALTIT